MLLLRSLIFNLAFVGWSLLVFVVAVIPLVLPPRMTFLVGRIWVKGVFGLLAVICGLRYEIRGREHVPDGPCIIASKHQSAWDTLVFSLLLDNPSYVIKRELIWVPLFGWFMWKIGAVAVDRAGGAKTLRAMVDSARAILDSGRPLVIYPEGTRTAPGQRRAYHPGVAALYVQIAVPVVPVALNSGRFWSRRSFIKNPGCIVLEFLPQIAPGLRRKDFLKLLEQRIEGASDRLAGIGVPPEPVPEQACG